MDRPDGLDLLAEMLTDNLIHACVVNSEHHADEVYAAYHRELFGIEQKTTWY